MICYLDEIQIKIEELEKENKKLIEENKKLKHRIEYLEFDIEAWKTLKARLQERYDATCNLINYLNNK